MNGQQLKNSILQMAIQGKLVPQDPNDEPASVLLEKIRKEKEQLIKEGKIKKEKNPSRIYRASDNAPYTFLEERGKEVIDITEELPFDIPDSWEWVRFSQLGDYKKGPFGSSLTKSIFVNKNSSTIKVYEQKNAIHKNSELGDYYITKEYFEEKMRGFEVLPGDIIVSCAGTIGETYVMPQNIQKGIINQALMRMRLFNSVFVEYFLLYFDYVLKKNAIESSKGSAIKNIPPFSVLNQYLVPIPPIEEQVRIVEIYNSVYPLINEYDNAESKKNELDYLLPSKLKQSILQEAIQGKLVPQDPNDEPASVLLERIRAEKEELIKQGKIKKDKNESIIFRRDNSYYEKLNNKETCIDDEIHYNLPPNWGVARLNTISRIESGGTPSRTISSYWGGDIHWIKIGDINNKYVNDSEEKITKKGLDNSSARLFEKGTLLYTIFATIGTVGILNINAATNQAVAGINFYGSVDINYMYYVALNMKHMALEQARGMAQLNINQTILKNLIIPIPPISEQTRIAKRIEYLFEIIDSLFTNR